jgi:hypothetical protein
MQSPAIPQSLSVDIATVVALSTFGPVLAVVGRPDVSSL